MTFTVTDLVGSDPTVSAAQTDPNLINPWGLAESATSPFWISDNGSGLTSIYKATSSGVTVNAIPPITIAVLRPDARHRQPNGPGLQQLRARWRVHFVRRITRYISVRNGGWNDLRLERQSRHAIDHCGRESHNPADGDEAMGVGAVHKGLAIGQGDNGPVLFAANFRHGTVDPTTRTSISSKVLPTPTCRRTLLRSTFRFWTASCS